MNDVKDEMRPGAALQPAAFKSDYKPIWCPGCGDFSVLSAFTKAFATVGTPHEIVSRLKARYVDVVDRVTLTFGTGGKQSPRELIA